MGMDVHGINPQQNKPIEEFPTYDKIEKMREEEGGWKKSWELLENDKELKELYLQSEANSKLINLIVH